MKVSHAPNDMEMEPEILSGARVGLLATGAGLAVASLYYSQPMLGVLASDLGVSGGSIGLVPTLTQLGYALGILLLTPLGDRCDRRALIAAKAALLAIVLLASALTTRFPALLLSSLMVGLAATLAQDIVPAAAVLAPPERRGRVVGTVMTGLLMGILLSRVVSGFVAEHFGWRIVFAGAALSVALMGVAVWRGLPRFEPAARMRYVELIASVFMLWRRHPALRRAAWSQGLLSLAFSAFWSTLAIMLHQRYGLGSSAAGAFGLAGAAGALAAPLAGRIADRRGPQAVARVGAALTAASFALLWLDGGLSASAAMVLIALASVGFDFGIQATLVAHQTIVYGLDPDARSRLNAALFTGVFVGMAAGGALGSFALSVSGWHAVVALAVAAASASLLLRLRAD
ncbi:MFS transporter [Methyloversatilis thermotolerans]|uniref:MFS transporter n=1 Tax=Methyloversatilis thermotolerans TaxID=1346290 RepID=UPI0003A34D03|nr:MFS transporter [Methyloversatilis thermotolerans]